MDVMLEMLYDRSNLPTIKAGWEHCEKRLKALAAELLSSPEPLWKSVDSDGSANAVAGDASADGAAAGVDDGALQDPDLIPMESDDAMEAPNVYDGPAAAPESINPSSSQPLVGVHSLEARQRRLARQIKKLQEEMSEIQNLSHESLASSSMTPTQEPARSAPGQLLTRFVLLTSSNNCVAWFHDSKPASSDRVARGLWKGG